MKTKITHLLLGSCFLALNLVAQNPIPAKEQTKKILIIGGYAHIGNGTVIENSVIAFEKGKITMVGDAKTVRIDKGYYDEVIDAHGKHVYPGIIAPNSTLGLTEIDAVRATLDFNDVGGLNPHVRSVIAYNTDNKISPTVRTNGVLLAQVTPRGGTISGTSSVMELEGWNWEDAVYKMDDGIHLNFPGLYSRSGSWGEPGQMEKNKDYDKRITELKKFFADAKAYNESANKEEANLRFQAMKGLFDGSKTLFIHADNAKQITEAIAFSKSTGTKRMVIVGGKDSWMVTDALKENNIPVIVNRVHDLPDKEEDDVDLPYKTPYLLHKAGVKFCLNNEGDMEAMGTRNLPFYAGTAAAYGLTKEEALMSVTLSTAKILGIDKTIGSIEQGKDATLFISTGDALDMKSNNVENAFIRGKAIDLNNEQKALYQKYKTKYGLK